MKDISTFIHKTLKTGLCLTAAFTMLNLVSMPGESLQMNERLLQLFTISQVEAARPLRVGLVNDQYAAEISCDNEMQLVISGTTMTLPKIKKFSHMQDGQLVFSDKISLRGGRAVITSLGKKPVEVNKFGYNGSIVIYPMGDKLTVTNDLNIDSYINSVLPAKTMVVWPDAAIKAQVIAARSYAMYAQQHAASRYYDLNAVDSEFRYFGTNAKIEKSNIIKLIHATGNAYLVDANGNPIKAVTTSSTGGQTESAEQAWGQDYSYLVSVDDDDSDSPEGDWEKQATPELFQGLLEQQGYDLGKLQSLYLSDFEDEDVVDRTATGRVKYMVVNGEKGSARVTGQLVADILQLDSTLFEISIGVPLPDSFKISIENRYGYEVGSKSVPIKYNDNRAAMGGKWDNQKLFSGVKDEKIIF